MGELVAATASSGGGVGWRGVAAHQRLLMMLQSVKEADLAAFFIARGRQRPPDRGMFCGLLRGWRRGRARGGPGGRNGGKGARFPKKVKKHTNKKSLPTSRTRPPCHRKTERLFFIAWALGTQIGSVISYSLTTRHPVVRHQATARLACEWGGRACTSGRPLP